METILFRILISLWVLVCDPGEETADRLDSRWSEADVSVFKVAEYKGF